MTSPDDQPQRSQRQLITADAALLAAQNERIDRLVTSIEQLTRAVSNRPTKDDLESTRKRLRNQLIATTLAALILFGFVFANERALNQQCVDRNNNTTAFRSLIVFLVGSTDNPETSKALQTYLDTLVKVDC